MILLDLGTVTCLEIINTDVQTCCLHDVGSLLLDVALSCSAQPVLPSLMTLDGLG